MARETQKSLTTCLMETISILDDISGRQQTERTLHNIVRKLSNMILPQTCAVIHIQTASERLEILNSSGLSWNFCKAYRKRSVSKAVQEFTWSEKPLYIRRSKEDEIRAHTFQLENQFASCYCVPLMANQKPLGYLHTDSREADFFSPDAQLMLQLYARIIAMALWKDSVLDEYREIARVTSAGGAMPYPLFFNQIQGAIAKSQRMNDPLSLVLIDVVKYDRILSSFGEKTASQVIEELMNAISGSIRRYDNMCRFGADEIMISLPGHGREEAASCARKIHDAVTEAEFTDKKLKLDLSIGIATFPDNGGSLSGLLTATKNALIEAKRSGGTRIFTSDTYFA